MVQVCLLTLHKKHDLGKLSTEKKQQIQRKKKVNLKKQQKKKAKKEAL